MNRKDENMNFSFDHLVWFNHNPENAIHSLSGQGIHVVQGGRHESWGTYNTLSYFGLSYIEFLGIEKIEIAEQHKENRLITQIVQQLNKENREGPAKIAIRTNQINELAIKLKQDGFTVYGPLPGQRVTAAGEVIGWSLLFIEDHPNQLSLPFFIQWEKSDKQRLAAFEEQGMLGRHSGTNSQFKSVGFVVRDLDETIRTWGKLLNLTPCKEFWDEALHARCQTLELPGTDLMFCTPLGEGTTEKVLHERGETPFLVNLSETNQSKFIEIMNGYWRFR
ncbi:VOC family protein [Neobacillus sp. DY30]|uniref:VOC family protein n=1 Tax=Neobacillus sp. DY30 TaxID=3047871 RepID=UPI0024C0981A|nr:VOC family protein [Neobacillus sp. DY30]WHX98172.1 VOC family protein [Neobacillus sp. DY30]